MSDDPTYIGDGIYAETDPVGISVYTSDGIEKSHPIYFGEDELQKLINFAVASGMKLEVPK